MAAISASLVKELRDRTGLGMMECKKALSEAGGDIEKAIEELRKSSGMKAAKKAGTVKKTARKAAATKKATKKKATKKKVATKKKAAKKPAARRTTKKKSVRRRS